MQTPKRNSESPGRLALRSVPGISKLLQSRSAGPIVRRYGRDLVTSLLQGVVNRGTGSGVRARGFSGPVAGKTGTTDDYRDAWFIGYSPELAVGVWVGFDDGRTLRHSGARAALPIFADFLVAALGSSGGRDFRQPLGVETVHVVAAQGHPAGLRCRGDPEVFLAGTEPRQRCDPWAWLYRGVGEEELFPVASPAPGEPPRRERRLWIRLPRWLDLFR